MKKKNKIVILTSLALLASLSTTAFATSERVLPTGKGNYISDRISTGAQTTSKKTISEVTINVDTPTLGGKVDKSPKISEGLKIDNVVWFDSNGNLYTADTFVAGTYKVRIWFLASSTDYTLANQITATINGQTAKVGMSGTKYAEYTFTVEAEKEITNLGDIEISNIQIGKKVSDCKITLPKGANYTATLKLAKIVSSNIPQMENDEKFESGITYRVLVEIFPNEGYKLASGVKGTINGDSSTTYSTVARKNRLILDLQLLEAVHEPDEEPEVVKEITDLGNIKVSNVKVGKRASNCKVTLPTGANYTAKLELAKIVSGGGVPQMEDDEKFEAGITYRVLVEIFPNDGYKLASDVKGTINSDSSTKYLTVAKKNRLALDVEMEEEKVTEKEEDNETKTNFSKCSDWAKDELAVAVSEELVPEIFNGTDVTQNITRKEFAHVAVKMYERITGQKALAVATNPFTDTNDAEILKAYNVGITNGTTTTTFSPDSLITREQMATMMTRALTKAGKNTARPANVNLFADDAEFSDYAKDSIYYMSSIEIIKGIGENKFNSKGNASREQALAISKRCVEKLGK